MNLVITKYSANSYGLDWAVDGRPAVERTFETEQAARDHSARAFPGYPIVRVRTWDEHRDKLA